MHPYAWIEHHTLKTVSKSNNDHILDPKQKNTKGKKYKQKYY